MGGRRTLGIVLGTLCAGTIGLLCANVAFAGARDSRFEFSSDGTLVDFDVRDVSRREVLNRLLGASGIDTKWINAVFADERIGGRLSGTPAAVLVQLLGRTNFVIVREGSNDTSRVVRVIVVGAAKGERSSAGLAALASAIQPVIATKEPASPESADGASSRAEGPSAQSPARAGDAAAVLASAPPLADTSPRTEGAMVLSDLRASGDASVFLTPPPQGVAAPMPVLKGGAEAPPLVAPSQTFTPLPLTPAAPGTAAPALRPVPSGRVD